MALSKEHHEQCALVQWAGLRAGRCPELSLLYAIPNGGERNIVVARKLKAEGVKPGVPDLCLPVAGSGYHGLYVEMKKAKGGRVGENQRWWLEKLNAQGYLATVCNGFDEGQAVIEAYLKGAL